MALPSSALGKVCKYAFTLWTKPTRFLEYPEIELSPNVAENSMRPVALGRNWIPIGSPHALQRFCRSSKAAAAESPGAG